MFELPEHPLSNRPNFDPECYWTAWLNHDPAFRDKLNLQPTLYIHDCTLRDGEQTPGVVFSTEEKVLLASMMDEIGVQSIELGLPMVEKDRQAILKMTGKPHRARLMALTRANRDDIDLSQDLGLEGLVVEHSVNPYTCRFAYKFDETQLIRKNVDAIIYARKKGFLVNWMGWDAFRVDPAYIERVFKTVVREADPEIITIADTFGMVHPLALFEFFKRMREWFPTKLIEYHAHNDYGMVTANAVTAILGGANAVHTAINGLGERAGNIPLEEFAVNLKNLYRIDLGLDLSGLHRLCRIAAQISRFPYAGNKPMAGDNLFKVESGMIMHIFINAAKNGFPPTIMLPYMPEQVGQPPLEYVLSKGSGKAAIEHFLDKLGITVPDESRMERIILEVKTLATILKGPLTLEDLKSIAQKIIQS
ncbi:MAG: hypothetical protein KBA26_02690 [Candidatus Delongbacteria bacterium]|nr:hypothetical protein [Candidatus Delongbacteria bacterium]